VAHIILVIGAIPSVLQAGHGQAPFLIGLIILAFASGFIVSLTPFTRVSRTGGEVTDSWTVVHRSSQKPSVSPLLADQSPVHKQEIKTLDSGEVVIVDPGMTIQGMMLNFYWAINIGSLLQLATTYCEKDVGFWLAYLVPVRPSFRRLSPDPD
jgi:POT family proton-dependent oligopeptide transporter